MLIYLHKLRCLYNQNLALIHVSKSKSYITYNFSMRHTSHIITNWNSDLSELLSDDFDFEHVGGSRVPGTISCNSLVRRFWEWTGTRWDRWWAQECKPPTYTFMYPRWRGIGWTEIEKSFVFVKTLNFRFWWIYTF